MDLQPADRRLILRASAVVLTLAVIVLLFAAAQTTFADGPGGVPDTPSGLEASAVHAGIVDIEWNQVEGVESYEVRVMPSGTWISLPGEGMEIAHYGAGAIVRNLPHEGRYYFSVRARNESGASEWSAFLFVQATGTPSEWSGVPEPVNAAATGTPSIVGRLSVGDTLTADTSGIADANGLERVRFRYQWISSDGTADTDIEGATSASYTLVSTDEGSTIKVRVSFTDRGGYEEGPLTGLATPEVGPEPEVPGAPRNLSVALAENGELTLSWEPPDSDGGAKVTGYRVEWKSDDEDYGPPRQAVVDSLSHRITGLTNGSDYKLRVLAVNRKGEGPASDEVTGSPRDTIPPELLAADVRGTKITLTYNKTLDDDSVPTGEAFGVTVNDDPRQVSDVSAEGSLVKLDLASVVRWNDTATVSYTPPSDLQAPRIKDTWGNSAGSFREALTPPLEVPGPPQNLSAGGENGELELSWDAPDSNGGSQVRGYRVQWKSGYEDYDPTRQTEVEHPSYTATGLTDGVEYALRVMASNEIGEGPPSAEVNASPQDTVDPELLTVAIYYATLRLHFSEALAAGSAPSEDAFNVVVSGTAQQVTNVSVDGRTLVLSLASSASSSDTVALSYTAPADPVAARIEDSSGNPAASFGETAAVWSDIPGPPVNLRAYPGESGVLTALWEAPSSIGGSLVTEYRLEWKSRDEDYDPSREAVVTGGREHSITGLAKGVEYALRVFAINSAGHGPSSLEVARKPRESNGPLYRYIEEKVVERYEGGSPWLRRTWEYMQSDEFELRVSSEGEYPFQGAAWEECWVVLSGGSDNELAKCRGRNMILQEPYTRSIGLILHEMGHVYTFTNAIHSYPGPEAIAWLYFDHPQFCAPSELYADALVGTVYSAAGETYRHWWGYWDACSHYPNAERAPTPQAALAEMQLVLNGEYPEWLHDTYADEQGNLDLVGLWNQVQRFGRFRDVVSYGLRNEFGGYCSNHWVRLDLLLGYHDQLNPWRAGGCLPSAPRDVKVVAGDRQVIVKWEEPLQEGALPISHYRIQWKELGAEYYSLYDLHRPNELAREDTISRLSNGVTYKVRVAAAHPNLNVGVQRSGIGAWVELTVTPRVNSRATGLPAISGIAHTGQTLTVDTAGIVDADGLTNVSYSYQWIRNDGNSDSDIPDATDTTYTLVSADEGKTIKVRVSFTDDADNQETLTSAATAAVAARPNSSATGAPTISGTTQSGETLTADTSSIADADGLTNVSYSYQWIRNDGNSDSDIPDATDTTYTLVSADEGKTIKVRVSFTDDADNQETLTSATTIIVDQPGTVSLWPELPRIGTVVKATLTDPDGLEGAGSGAAASLGAVSWQWTRSSEGSIWTSVDVYEDGDSYTPTEDDEGMRLKVTAVYTDGHGRGKSAEAITAATVGAREASPELTVTQLVTGLTHPWDIVFTPDGTMLFTERDDGLRVRLTDGTVRQVTADFSDLNFGGTAGLLALVLDPDFVSNRRFYTYQRHTGPEMQVIAWTIDQDYTVATRVVDPLVGGIPVNRNRGPSHGGGRLRFGPEGYLWIAAGDGFSGTAAQDLTSLGGKVLRVDSQTGAGAPGNPFAPSPVYTYGHRNPQGLALRPGTGQMWSVEHGPDHDDEINLIVSGGNYGWDPAPEEGVESLYDETTTPMTDLVKFPDALQAKWSSGYPTLAVGGGVFLQGSQWREWEGQFAVATLKTKSARVFKFTEGGDLMSQVVVPELDRTYGRLRSAVLGPDGALYITTTNGGGKDKILKVVPTSSPATGLPTIIGTPQEDETLTADISGITDADGLTSVSYSYQWIANDGNSDTDLGGATSPTYTPSDADVGKTIKVRVSFTDDADNEETLTSAATTAVAARPNTPATGLPTISGTAQVDETLTADTSGIADEDGLDNDTFSYQWIRSDGNNDTDIGGQTGSTYTLVSADKGKTIKVRVSFTDDADNEETLTSAATTAVAARPNTPATGQPTISGTAQVDETLTADTSGIADEDGLDNATFSYQWIRSVGNNDTDISGQTGSTYTLASADKGKTIKVRVAFTDDADNEETLTSAATAAVTPQPDNMVSDEDPAVWSADMLVVDLGNGSIGAVSANLFSNQGGSAGLQAKWLWYYTPGRYIRLSFTDVVPGGEELTLEIGAVALTLQAGDSAFTWDDVDVDWEDGQIIPVRILPTSATAVSQPNSPATGAPTISGAAQEDETLTVDTSRIADADGLENVSYSYQWIRNDESNDSDIPDATDTTYTLDANDVGKTIKVRVTFTDDRDNAETLTSVATATVAVPPNTPATGPPTINGTAQVDETLTADTSGIADEDGLDNATFSYQWIRSDGNNDTDISGQTGSTYTLVSADKGKTIKVRVAFTDDADNEETLTSAATTAVAARPNTPATGLPTISGMAQVDETLTADTSGIADEDGLTNMSYSYQWIRSDGNNDTDIGGQTGSTYTLVSADKGKTIKVRATFTDDADNEETLTSKATEVVQQGSNAWSATMTVETRDGFTGYSFWGDPHLGSLSATEVEWDGKTHYVRFLFLQDGELRLGLNEEMFSTGFVLSVGDEEFGSADAMVDKGGASYRFRWDDPGLGWSDGNEVSVNLVQSDQNTPALGPPTISGTVQVDETLTADTSGVEDADGLTNVSYSYQWMADGVDIQDATSSTYKLVFPDQGKSIKVKVSFSDDADHEETLTSNPTRSVTAAPNRQATGKPTIGGTPQVDQTLTADTSNIADQDGLTNVSYSYQWIAVGTDIDGATGSSYELMSSEQGQTIQVRVTFTDDRDNAETLTSAATVAVVAAPNREATGLPTISGTPQVGETLTADISNIADEDGLDNVSYGYQWIRSDGDTDTEIAGETSSTYTVADDDVGKHVKVRVAFIDDAGNEESLTSGTTEVLVDYDADNDGLIEVTTLKQLDAIRHDLDGDGIPTDDGVAAYTAAFPGPVERMGCSGADGCAGYEIMADLDFDTNGSGDDDAGDTYWNDGAGWTPIGGGASEISSTGWTMHNPFLAIFEGNGRTISNLFVDKRGSFLGLFGYVGFDAASGAIGVIRNVNLIDVNVTGGHDGSGLAAVNLGVITNSQVTGLVTGVNIVGGLVGENYGVIADSHVAGCVSGGTMVGGLVGRSYGAITNSSVTGCVSALSYVGGLVGNNYGLITGSHTAGRVSGHGLVIGGLVGSHKGAITASRSTARVLGTDSGPQSNIIGGLVGDNRGVIAASYATGHVSGEGWIGGLVGQSASVAESPSAITASYATGRVSGTRKIGGLVGVNDGAITASYAAGPVSGSEDVGGLAGTSGGVITASYWDTRTSGHPAGSHGVGKTTAELQAPTGYSGIYETWNLNSDDVPDSPWDLGSATQHLALAAGLEVDIDGVLDSLWDLGSASQYPALAADLDGAGRATWQEFGHQLRAGPVLTTTVTPGEDSVELSWTAVDTSHWSPVPTVTYTLYRGDGDTVEAIVRDLEGLIHTDDDVTSGETYSYQVVAVVAGGEAAHSALDSETPGVNAPATGAPTISGTGQVDETLTVDTSTIADEDGLTNVSYSYQWIAGGSDIDGATGFSYELTSNEQGQTIQVRVTFIDDRDNEETLTSAATVAVAAAANRGATGQPTISGTPQVGQTLTADTANIVDQDGLTGVSYTYQWIAGGTDIDGATGSSYLLTSSDQGQTIQVRMTFTDDRDNEETLTSAATVAVTAAANREATGQPTISGTPQVGETLTADTSPITDEDGLTNASYGYQWTAGGSDIDGATGSSHTLTASEQGQTIQVRVTFTDDADNEETLTSEATAEVTAAPVPLTVSVTVSAPPSHDGSSEFTFEIEFSEEFGISYRTLKFHAFTVTGGSVEKAQRTDKPSNIRWLITVKPQGSGDVTIELPATTDCDADGAICTADGRKLSNSLSFTVSGLGG